MESRIIEHADVPPEDLAANPRNWREHPAVQREALRGILDDIGWVQEVIVNKRSGRIVDGHLRVDLARQNGEATVPVIYVDLSDAEERTMLLALDPIAELATPDRTAVMELLDGLETPNPQVRDLLASIGNRYGERAVVPPEADAVPENVAHRIQSGELWQLGDHRLLCGDATKSEDVERLMAGERADCTVTDPPYAIYGSSTGLSASVTDDKIVRPFFRDVLRGAEIASRLFAHVYVFCDWRSWPAWWEVAKDGHLTPKNLLVWSKNGSGLGSNYANTYELIGFFALLPEQKTMTGSTSSGQRSVLRPNILTANRPTGDDRQHNAAKPVDLLEELIGNSTDSGDVVLDLFMGSGSTLIASEHLGRRCYGMEIEPKYCDVAVTRWEQFTGQTAERLTPHSEI